jgi:hypothetical protein
LPTETVSGSPFTVRGSQLGWQFAVRGSRLVSD